jgi:hypothetical protein
MLHDIFKTGIEVSSTKISCHVRTAITLIPKVRNKPFKAFPFSFP